MTRLGGRRSYRVDYSKIEAHVPAFQPVWSVAKGVQQNAYVTEALTRDEFAGSRYTRIGTIKRRHASGELGGDLRPVDRSPVSMSTDRAKGDSHAVTACLFCHTPLHD